jgi:hypothetical protein
MALTFIEYTGDGLTSTYAVPFDYIDAANIKVYVDGVEDTGRVFNSPSVIQTSTPPPQGALVKVVRKTDLTSRSVDFASGSILTEEDLDTSNIQVFYASQESQEVAESGVSITPAGNFSATYNGLNRRISDVADPVDAQDVATKNWVETDWLSPADKAQLNAIDVNKLHTTADNIADVNDVADNMTDVNTVAGSIANVVTTANDINNVNIVANSIADVNRVEDSISQIDRLETSIAYLDRLYQSISQLDRLHTSISKLDRVHTSIGNVDRVHTSIDNVDRVFNSIAAVDTVASDLNEPVSEIETVATDIVNVNTVGTNMADVNSVATNITHVQNVSNNETNINAAVSNQSNINAAVNNESNINAAVANEADISAVAGNEANINTVAANNANVTTVANNDANVTTVATNIAAVQAASTNMADIQEVATEVQKVITVANDLNEATSEIEVVAASIANVDAVGTNIQNVLDVDANEANINAAVANSTNINAAVSNQSNINAAVSNSTNINAAVANQANINDAVANETNINAVVANEADIDTVAANMTDVNTVASRDADIDTVATNIGDITSVAGNATNINTVAANTTPINTVATNISNVQDFFDTYFVSATNPASPTTGDLWFDTTANLLKVYDGSSWANAGSSINGTSARFKFTATSGQTTFSGADANGETLAYDAGYIDLYLNGVHLDPSDYTAASGTSIILDAGATAGDELYVVAFGTFALNTHYSSAEINNLFYDKTEADARYMDINEETLPSQSGHSGQFLTTDGTNADWATVDLTTKVSKSGDSMTGDLSFGDNNKAIFGAGSDLQIYHDGSNSYIKDAGTGHLQLWCNDLRISNADGSKSYLYGNNGGSLVFNYDGSQKLATTSTGIDVTGTVAATSYTGDGSQLTGILPDQTGHSGQFLQTNGTTADWGSPAIIKTAHHKWDTYQQISFVSTGGYYICNDSSFTYTAIGTGKLLVHVTPSVYTNQHYGGIALFMDGSIVNASSAGGSRNIVHAGVPIVNYQTSPHAFVVEIDISSAGSYTFDVRVQSKYASSGYFIFNRGGYHAGDPNATYNISAVSTITVYEVA